MVNKYLLGTAGFAAVAAFWSQIKGLFVRFRSFFIVTAQIKYSLDRALVRYLWNNFRCGMLGNRTYLAQNMFVRSSNDTLLVAFEDIGGSLTFFKGWKPIFVSNNNNDKDSSGTLTISFVRGTFKIEQLLLDAINEFNKYEKNQVDNR